MRTSPRVRAAVKSHLHFQTEPDYAAFDDIQTILVHVGTELWSKTLTSSLWRNGIRPSELVAEVCANYAVHVVEHIDDKGDSHFVIEGDNIEDATKASIHIGWATVIKRKSAHLVHMSSVCGRA